MNFGLKECEKISSKKKDITQGKIIIVDQINLLLNNILQQAWKNVSYGGGVGLLEIYIF